MACLRVAVISCGARPARYPVPPAASAPFRPGGGPGPPPPDASHRRRTRFWVRDSKSIRFDFEMGVAKHATALPRLKFCIHWRNSAPTEQENARHCERAFR
jgi:hypothetical protein